MPNLIIAPSLERELVQRKAIVTVDGAMARFKAHPFGTPLDDIPLPFYRLQMVLRDFANQTIERMQIRGYDYWDPDDIHVYGPYPSRMLHEYLCSLKDANTDELGAAGLVHSPPKGIEAFADYWLVANYVKRLENDEIMDEEAREVPDRSEELYA